MALPAKDYYRVTELAAAWKCSDDDIFHHFLHDRIRLGIRVHHKMLYGLYELDGELRTVGIYSVSGVITIPKACAKTWELGGEEVSRAGGFVVENDYRPEIVEASYLDEASFSPPIFPWAPGRDWENPETDQGLIARFVVGKNDLSPIKKSDVVVHSVERARFEGEHNDTTPLDPVPPSREHVSDKLAKLNQAAARFWRNANRADRGTHPDNASVVKWLEERGFSTTLAEKAATIIRPEWAPTGRKPEK